MTRLPNCTAKLLPAVGLLGLIACHSEPSAALSREEKLARIEAMVAEARREFPEVPGVGAAQLAAELEQGSVVLVDVRTDKERSVSTIPGSISRTEFEARAKELEGKAIVAYCTIGQRSSDYARQLLAEGWNARNFEGSVLAWTWFGGALVDSEGRPTRRVDVYGERWNLVADGYEPVW